MGVAGDLYVEVKDIKGTCPVYERGDSFEIADGFKLKTDKTICMHSLASIIPYYMTLSRGTSPAELGLGDDRAHVQCLDPCEYTGGGTVVFEITRENRSR